MRRRAGGGHLLPSAGPPPLRPHWLHLRRHPRALRGLRRRRSVIFPDPRRRSPFWSVLRDARLAANIDDRHVLSHDRRPPTASHERLPPTPRGLPSSRHHAANAHDPPPRLIATRRAGSRLLFLISFLLLLAKAADALLQSKPRQNAPARSASSWPTTFGRLASPPPLLRSRGPPERPQSLASSSSSSSNSSSI